MNIDKATMMNNVQRGFLFRYFARLPFENQVKILAKHRKILFMQKQTYKNEDITHLSYTAFVLAIKHHLSDEKKLLKKRFEDMSLDEIKDLAMTNLNKFKMNKSKKLSKRDRVLALWAVVKTLRSENISFRGISNYLKKNHHFDVGHSLIHMMWQELEDGKHG